MGQEMKQPEVAQPSVEWGLGLSWAIASIAGLLLGFTAAQFLFGLVSVTSSLTADIATLALMFTVAGMAQGRALGKRFSWSAGNFYGQWVLASALGGLAFMVTAGLGIGIAQWLVLRRHIPRAGWWIAASVVGWGLLYIGGSLLLTSAVGGVVTGGVLVWLLRQPGIVTDDSSLQVTEESSSPEYWP